MDRFPVQRLLDELHARYSDLDRRQPRELHPRARRGRPAPVRDLARDRRRLRLRRGRPRGPLHHPVGLQGDRLWPGARGLGPCRGAAADRRRAVGRPVQLDHLRREQQPAVQPDGQCRRDRRRGADQGPRQGRAARAHARDLRALRRPSGGHRRAGLPLRDRDRAPQPRDRLSRAQCRDDRGQCRGASRPLFHAMLDPGHGARPRGDGGDAGQWRHQPGHRRSARCAPTMSATCSA